MSLPPHLEQLAESLAAVDDIEDEDGVMLLSELDGMLAGLLVSPELIPPAEWLPMVLGQFDRDLAEFENEPGMPQAIRGVLQQHEVVAAEMASGRPYVPMFDIDGGETIWETWIRGFSIAMGLRVDSWTTMMNDTADQRASLAAFGMVSLGMITDGTPGLDATEEETAALAERAPELIPEWVETLYHRKMFGRSEVQQPIVSTKIGRNEPCPCGSGKKYKKCCSAG